MSSSKPSDSCKPEYAGAAPTRVLNGASQLVSRRLFLNVAFRDLSACTHVAKRLFLQGIAQRYRYSSLGIFWAFMPSAMIAVLLTVGQRAQIFDGRSGIISPQVYGIFGLVMMQTFLEAMQSQRVLLTRHSHLLIRQKVPIEGLILSGIAEAGFALLVRLPVLIAVLIFFDISPPATAPLALMGFATLIGLGAGAGLFLAPWNVLSRDLESLMNFLPWLLFAITPVFVAVPSNSYVFSLYQLNPLTHLFELIRWMAYGSGEVTIFSICLLPLTCLLLVAGWLFCRLCLPYIIERSLI